jgi:zeaxanthin glucosyltransferase
MAESPSDRPRRSSAVVGEARSLGLSAESPSDRPRRSSAVVGEARSLGLSAESPSDRPARVLFVPLPLAGHANPEVAVGRALAAQGHDVAWVGPEGTLRPLLGPDDRVYPTGMRPYRGQLDRGLAAIRSLWTDFVVPYARFTLPAVRKAIADYRPDALAVDQHALAGAVAAREAGLPWATLVPQSMELTRPLARLTTVDGWVRGKMAEVCGPGFEARFSPHLVVAFNTPALAGPGPYPANCAFVGPALGPRPPVPDFPWDLLDPGRRTVLVTVGTLAGDVATDFHGRVVEAVRPLGVQVILVGSAPVPAENVLVAPRVPLLELLPRLSAVVSHGGLNTVTETLAHGVPLVVAPIRHDQPVNAAAVARAGAGVRVHFDRVTPQRLRAALTAVLDEPGYRAAAARIRDSFTAAGGAPAAASRLAQLSTMERVPT